MHENYHSVLPKHVLTQTSFSYPLPPPRPPAPQIQTGLRGSEEGGNTVANRDLVKLLDPRINSMNYIYDNFEWDHCAADGINMDDAWSSLPNPEVVLWYQ